MRTAEDRVPSRLRMISGSAAQTTLDDLMDEVTALQREAFDVAARGLPLARQLRIAAPALGPRCIAIADELVRLLEREQARHSRGGLAA